LLLNDWLEVHDCSSYLLNVCGSSDALCTHLNEGKEEKEKSLQIAQSSSLKRKAI
jgi:hypothetical protein